MESAVLLAVVYTGIVLGVLGYLDYRYREIDPEIWYPLIIIGAGIGFYYSSLLYDAKLYMAGIVVAIAITGIFTVSYLLGLMGGADIYAVTFLSLTLPTPLHGTGLPPVLSVILYSSILAAIYRAISIGYALGPRHILKSSIKIEKRRLLEDVRLKWWLPKGIDIEEDLAEELYKAPGEILQASPGIPLITMMFIGFLAYLVLGDLLYKLASTILG
ncbi:MAG: prepilin peptidase [Desulfurococcales archaeon]|nr:prepilin peptidase [Desulfurococcales archaeon]